MSGCKNIDSQKTIPQCDTHRNTHRKVHTVNRGDALCAVELKTVALLTYNKINVNERGQRSFFVAPNDFF